MITPFDIDRISGTNRSRETSDKPTNSPDYIRDMRQNPDGVWETRQAVGHVYPQRGNHYEFITPQGERNISALPKDLVELELYEKYYNSHRRKTMVTFLDTQGNHWVFRGVIKDHNVSAQYQELEIWRSKVDADHVTEISDQYPATNSTYGKILNECYFVLPLSGSDYPERNPDNIDGSFIQYSMVAGAASIYIAIVLRKSGVGEKKLWVVKLTDLFEDDWGGDTAYPTWTGVGDAGTGADGKIVDTTDSGGLSMTVDLEIDDDLNLYLIYGLFYDTLWRLRYLTYDADGDVWDTPATTIYTAGNNVYGAVLKRYENSLYLAYLNKLSSLFSIRYMT